MLRLGVTVTIADQRWKGLTGFWPWSSRTSAGTVNVPFFLLFLLFLFGDFLEIGCGCDTESRNNQFPVIPTLGGRFSRFFFSALRLGLCIGTGGVILRKEKKQRVLNGLKWSQGLQGEYLEKDSVSLFFRGPQQRCGCSRAITFDHIVLCLCSARAHADHHPWLWNCRIPWISRHGEGVCGISRA